MNKISQAMAAATVQTQLQVRSTKMQRFVRITGVVLIVAMMMMSFAFAAGTASSQIEAGIKGGTKQLYSIMTAVIIPVAAVFFAWNAFKALFGGEKGMEQAKKNMLTIVLVLALVWLAPLIVSEVSSWFDKTTGAGAGSSIFS